MDRVVEEREEILVTHRAEPVDLRLYPLASLILAGVVTQLFGPQAGGLFLAFPAILLATLTLLEKKEGRTAAVASSEGAVLGAVGLAVFGFVFEAAIAKSAPGLALVLALVAWIGTSVALYEAVEVVRRRK